jgi:hypothetical protein
MCESKPHRGDDRRVTNQQQFGSLDILRERIALVAKDFHHQAQWALVAMPAPIYRSRTA